MKRQRYFIKSDAGKVVTSQHAANRAKSQGYREVTYWEWDDFICQLVRGVNVDNLQL